jgi:hypothetical protein
MTTKAAPSSSIAGAMLKAQSNITMPRKDGTNPHFKSKYATLGAVLEVLRQPCIDAGLVVTQAIGQGEVGDVLVTTIRHVESADAWQNICRLPLDKQTVQGVGSSITYMRRYQLMALFMLNAEDDDGNAASKPTPPVVKKAANSPSEDRVLLPAQSAANLNELLDELQHFAGAKGSAKGLREWAHNIGARVTGGLTAPDEKKFRKAYSLAVMGDNDAAENDDPPTPGE